MICWERCSPITFVMIYWIIKSGLIILIWAVGRPMRQFTWLVSRLCLELSLSISLWLLFWMDLMIPNFFKNIICLMLISITSKLHGSSTIDTMKAWYLFMILINLFLIYPYSPTKPSWDVCLTWCSLSLESPKKVNTKTISYSMTFFVLSPI